VLLRRKKHRAKPLRAYQGCPMLRGRACACPMLCFPVAGKGLCGRHAPHGLRGRTQLAIDISTRRCTRCSLGEGGEVGAS